MKLRISAKPGAKKDEVTLIKKTGMLFEEQNVKDFLELRVSVKEPAKEGKANNAIVTVVADYFGVPRSRVKIISGHTSHTKVIEVAE